MTTEQFVYWLQGFMEMADPKELNKTQTQQIKDHLKLVFDKQTPDRDLQYIPSPNYQWLPDPIAPGAPTIICETSSTSQTPSDQELDRAINRPKRRGGSKGPTVYC
jgi:hypothetical protein